MKSDNDHIQLAINSTSIGFVGRIIGRSFVVVQGFLIARALGPALFGLYAIGLSMFRLIEMIAPLGFDVGVIRFGTKYLISGSIQKYKSMILNSLIISFFFSALLGLILYIYADWVSINIYENRKTDIIFKFFAILIPLSAMLSIIGAIGRINNQVRYSILIQDLLQPLLALSFLIIFFAVGLRLELVMIADQLSYFFTILVIIFFVLKTTDTFSFTDNNFSFDKAYYSFSLLSAGSIFLSTAVFWVDRFFAGVYLSPEDMGIYQAGLQVAALFAVVSGAFNRNILPVFSTLYAEEKMQELQDIFRIATKWNFYFWLPFILFFSFNTTSILQLLYGNAYIEGSIPLLILLAGQAVNLITGSVGIVLMVGGFQRFIVSLSFFALIINIITCIVLIPLFGLIGASLSNAISTIILYVSLIILAQKKMKLFPYDIQYIKGFIAIFVTAGAAMIIKRFIIDFTVISASVGFFLSFIVFFISLICLGLSNEDKLFLSTALRKLGILRTIG